MPAKLTKRGPSVRNAVHSRFKMCLLEMKSIQPFLLADLDTSSREQVVRSLDNVVVNLQWIRSWAAAPPPTKAERAAAIAAKRGTVAKPLSMRPAQTPDGDVEE